MDVAYKGEVTKAFFSFNSWMKFFNHILTTEHNFNQKMIDKIDYEYVRGLYDMFFRTDEAALAINDRTIREIDEVTELLPIDSQIRIDFLHPRI